MAKKKVLLPKNFEELLERADPAELRAVFDTCDVNARGGYGKQTALAFDKCPDDLAKWLVDQGADLEATDAWGNTPLHQRARSRRSSVEALLQMGADVHNKGASIGTPLHAAAASHNVESARLLLQYGAKIDETNREGLTPLELALQGCTNIDIEDMAALSRLLLDAGAGQTPRARAFVKEIGERFEFHRSGFNREMVDAVSDALSQLYLLFEVAPVRRRQMHDGRSPIVVTEETWQAQHQEMWDLLVPSAGPAATAQGEAIRISGRISYELEGNGGINWDADYARMADAFLEIVRSGAPLSSAELEEAASIVVQVKRKSGDTARLAQLAVRWVIQNPLPLRLAAPPYKR